MAERDYALEMWRLLDPDSNLISCKELLDRIVCVKSGKWHVPFFLGVYFTFQTGSYIPAIGTLKYQIKKVPAF